MDYAETSRLKFYTAISSCKLLIAFLLISQLLLLQLVESDETVNGHDSLSSSAIDEINCPVACQARCRLTSRQKMCLRACGTCCARCNCVPPGTSGNQMVCPCYYYMKTHGGQRKCP